MISRSYRIDVETNMISVIRCAVQLLGTQLKITNLLRDDSTFSDRK